MLQLFLGALLIQDGFATELFEPRPLSEEAYAETYTAVASFDDGSYVLLQLLFSNAGFGDRKAACRGLWVPDGGEAVNSSINVDEDGWAHDSGSDTLTVGDCSLSASEGGVRFRVALPELDIDLQVRSAASSVEPPDHRIESGDTFYEFDVLLPHGEVEASISSGSRRVRATGAAYMDHSRSNALLPDVASCWVRFRGFHGDEPALLQVRVPSADQGGSHRGWIWPYGRNEPIAASASGIRLGTSGNLPTVRVSGGGSTVSVTADREIYRYRPTEAYGALGRLAAPWVGDPTTVTYRATATGASNSTFTGILEVSEIEAGGCSQ